MAIKQLEKIDTVISNMNVAYRAFIIPLMYFHGHKLLRIDYNHKFKFQIICGREYPRCYGVSCNIFYGQLPNFDSLLVELSPVVSDTCTMSEDQGMH